MPKINLLDSSVYNRIAAGEVVQQPASVVKELVENSIDSGATDITIEILDGGIREIRIKDNGCGIAREDIKNAFLPHATSKVKDIEDLDSISTLGFRGEALASIASVSIVDIDSKQSTDQVGSSLSIRGGDFSDITDSACSNGTTISVQNLFFNTPARAKFLKKPHQEETEVTSVVQKTIFANPNISFTYTVDGDIVYKTSGDGLLSSIYSVYGRDVQDNCIEVDETKRGVSVKGYICAPNTTKPNRNYQTIIINGRFIKDFSISSVVANAYGDRLMKRCFPIFVLDILVPFDDVDVNVHPAKTEVRFRKQSEVYGAIYTAVVNALEEREKNISLLFNEPISEPRNVEQTIETIKNNATLDDNITDSTQPEPPKVAPWLADLLKSDDTSTIFCEKSVNIHENYTILNNPDGTEEIISTQRDTQPTVTVKPNAVFDQLRYDYVYIGQLFDCYLLLQYEDQFLLIDQHAAHERLLFDELMKKAGDFPIQQLLLPFVKTFSPNDWDRILQILPSLTSLGIEIEEFGRYTIKVSALPMPLVDMNVSEFLDGFLAENSMKVDFSYGDVLREKLAKRACKSAIKAGQSLQKAQIDTLIHQIIDSNMVLQCPHGRPIVVKFSKKDIEKLFKRLV